MPIGPLRLAGAARYDRRTLKDRFGRSTACPYSTAVPALPERSEPMGYRPVNVGQGRNPGGAGVRGAAYSCVARIQLNPYLMGAKRATCRVHRRPGRGAGGDRGSHRRVQRRGRARKPHIRVQRGGAGVAGIWPRQAGRPGADGPADLYPAGYRGRAGLDSRRQLLRGAADQDAVEFWDRVDITEQERAGLRPELVRARHGLGLVTDS